MSEGGLSVEVVKCLLLSKNTFLLFSARISEYVRLCIHMNMCVHYAPFHRERNFGQSSQPAPTYFDSLYVVLLSTLSEVRILDPDGGAIELKRQKVVNQTI